jgi:2,3-bisphosphoglycerate-independent phosphoglycerate mutase
MTKTYSPVVLLIFDGFGIAKPGPGNAITRAHMPNFQNARVRSTHGELQASGTAVGLTPGEVGSTEVGHLNIGAGRIVYQDLPRINMSIEEGSFFKNPALLHAAEHVKQNNSDIHFMGLASSGNVHSSTDHLYALLTFAKQQGIAPEKVKIHAFLDGRDTPPTAGALFIAQIQDKIKEIGVGQIASIAGRYYAMDRDNRWDRIEKEYTALVHGTGVHATDPYNAVQDNYKQSITDEFVPPTNIVDQNDQPLGLIKDNDAAVFFNFRTDRPRELTKAFVLDTMDTNTATTFNRGPKLQNLFFRHHD